MKSLQLLPRVYSPHPVSTEPKALPLGWLLGPKDGTLAERVLARLIQLEAHEPDVSLRDDIRQSFITLTLAMRGNTMPFVVASYQMYGLHPDKVWPAILARRSALLGAAGEVAPIESQDLSGSIPPKKSVHSVRTKDEGVA